MNTFPTAMTPPEGDITYLQEDMVLEAIRLSRESPRRRIILPFHKTPGDTLNRMLNVLQPDSYIIPHSHLGENKAESIVVLHGGIRYLTFNETGELISSKEIRARSFCFGVDIEPHIIHSFYALEEDTVLFEVKPGPYNKDADKNFAAWAPEEYTPEASAYLKKLKKSFPGK